MHLPRNFMTLLVAAVLPLGVLACAGDADEELDEELGAPAETPAPAPADMEAMTVALAPVGNSGITGEAVFDNEGDAQTTVQVRIAGSQANAVHQGHIHLGTCEAPGDVVVPLPAITVGEDGTGQSETTVALAPATTFNGQHIVMYHEAGGAPGASVTCAAIPQHTM